ncbi:DUF481 domain-containing protein [Parashewanella spongiae]|uniref:DUF481 domain-containing protein n=1 Tax=Parashewanella spongiae TaxID=342950 RepID=A0A3A6U8L2_9GAMM|nr:DUF481 domain-containing protein [Parashewanella spongiae]MCL1078519.1 DUF481 domain-containing protein [Parashewanella spongiae]RJY14714.1 DUF481 domain-containing protein [Parashewanella spongiae]
MKSACGLFFSFVCFSGSTFAIVPTLYQDPEQHFTAEIEVGFQLNTGNNSATSFNGRTNLVYDTNSAKQEVTVRGFFASDSERTTSEKYELNLQSNYKLSSGYVFAQSDYVRDRYGSYTKLATISSGYGFDAIDTKKAKLSLELSPGYRYNLPIETDVVPVPQSNTDTILRTAARFSYKMHEYTSFTADLTAENGAENNTLTLDTSYKNLMFKDWAFKVGINIKYTDVVPEGSKRTDTVTTFNLLYTFE